MLSIRDLGKGFGTGAGARVLFSGVNLEVAAGEFVAITGESGSGKSTVLNVIAGLETADRGSVHVEGIQLAELNDRERSAFRRARLGFVFQAFHLLPYLDIADNVGLPLVILGWRERERRTRVARALAAVGLDGRAQSRPSELSGGEMQRAAIARALIHDPLLVLADEPTGNLDAANADLVLALLRERVAQQEAACILVTHSAIAAGAAQRCYQLRTDGLHPLDAR